MRTVDCLHCGKLFTTVHSHKKYCTPDCQIKQSAIDQWSRNGRDYTYRLRRLLAGAKNRATSKDLPFNLDIEYLIDLWNTCEGMCTLTGREFDLATPKDGKPLANSPSLDRIIPELGYTKGNVRLVIFHINVAIMQYGTEAFELLLEDYQNYNN